MNRVELLKIAKPILFNTEMVRAILDGRKTVTRRVIKLKYDNTHIEIRNSKYGKEVIEIQNDVEGETYGTNTDGIHWRKLLGYIEKCPPYKIGDILYVRETWANCNIASPEKYLYKAVYDLSIYPYCNWMWHPSIHMPKEAARIFLKVTNVRVERLQDITEEGVCKEGAEPLISCKYEHTIYYLDGGMEACFNTGCCSYCPALEETYAELFGKLVWNETIKTIDKNIYGWDANPWVWVIEFERVM